MRFTDALQYAQTGLILLSIIRVFRGKRWALIVWGNGIVSNFIVIVLRPAPLVWFNLTLSCIMFALWLGWHDDDDDDGKRHPVRDWMASLQLMRLAQAITVPE